MNGNCEDNWKHRSAGMRCGTCMYSVQKLDENGKKTELGRCRRHAPTMSGWPAVYESDWCGDHKLDENKLCSSKPTTKVQIPNLDACEPGQRRL